MIQIECAVLVALLETTYAVEMRQSVSAQPIETFETFETTYAVGMASPAKTISTYIFETTYAADNLLLLKTILIRNDLYSRGAHNLFAPCAKNLLRRRCRIFRVRCLEGSIALNDGPLVLCPCSQLV